MSPRETAAKSESRVTHHYYSCHNKHESTKMKRDTSQRGDRHVTWVSLQLGFSTLPRTPKQTVSRPSQPLPLSLPPTIHSKRTKAYHLRTVLQSTHSLHSHFGGLAHGTRVGNFIRHPSVHQLAQSSTQERHLVGNRKWGNRRTAEKRDGRIIVYFCCESRAKRTLLLPWMH